MTEDQFDRLISLLEKYVDLSSKHLEINKKNLEVGEKSIDINQRILNIQMSNNVKIQSAEREGNIEIIKRIYGE